MARQQLGISSITDDGAVRHGKELIRTNLLQCDSLTFQTGCDNT